MKKILLAGVTALLAAVLSVSLIACADKPLPANSLYDPEKMEVVKNVSAFDIFTQVYADWQDEEKYRVDCDLVFTSNAPSMNMTQHFIKNGEEYYDDLVQFAKGVGANGKTYAHKFYYSEDSVKAMYTTKKISEPDDNGVVTADWTGIKWGEFDSSATKFYESKGISTALEHKGLLTDILSYNLAKENTDGEIDKFYTDGNGKYYGTVVIDCMSEGVEKRHPDVIKAIEDGTGGKFKTFDADTVISFQVVPYEDKYRLTQLVLEEHYTGSVGISVKCNQRYWYTFSYDEESVKIPAIG